MMPLYREHPALVTAFTIVVVLALLAGAYLAYLQAAGTPTPETAPEPEATMTILEGTYVCLPLKDGSTPRECSPGLRTGDGKYYALDLSEVIGAGGELNLSNNTALTVGGEAVAIADLSTEQWDKYSTEMLMRVKEVAR